MFANVRYSQWSTGNHSSILSSMLPRLVSPHFFCFLAHDPLQSGIWNAGSAEDYKATTALTGEPIIETMLPDSAISEPMDKVTNTEDESGITAYELWQIQKRRRDLRQAYLDHWESTSETTGTGRPVDAIIAPTAPYVAPPHGQNRSHFFQSVNRFFGLIPCSFAD